MDFHSLTRKELQTLCKKNKIPANITNVAMADALTALENVVGLEFINQSQSPEEIAESPAVPRTASRASSLARNDQDPQTAQPLTRTRRTATRRRMIDLDQDQDQENKKNVNLPETPAVPASRRRATAAEKDNQTVGTPAAQSERRRRPAASVQRTRQSVRLLEKTMAQLSLKDKGKTEPVKMMDVSESFEKTSDNEVSSNIESVENKEETKDVVELLDKSVADQEEVHHDEKFDDMLADKSKSVTVIDEMESVAVAVAVTEFPSETENASSELMGPEQQCLADNVSDENSGKVMEDVVPNHVEAEEPIAVDEIQKNLDHFVEKHTAADEVPSDKNFAKVIEDVVPHHVEAEESIAADEIQKDLDNFVAESTAADESPYKNSDKVMDDVVQHHVEAEANEKDSDHFVTESTAADDSPSDYDSGSDDSVVDQLDTTAAEPECVEKEMVNLENVVAPNNQKFDTEELIDVSLIEAEVPMSNEDETAKSVKQISNPSEENGNGNPDSTMKNLVDVYIMQAEGADLLPFQFPRPTPVESSSKKKQEANEKLTTVAADNKENIDSSGMKLESKKDKVKKNKNTVDEDMMLKALEDKSLRMLTKMLKEKLKINNKKNDKINNEEESIVKVVGKTRPALQTLEENQMHPGEPKNEN
ncbi:Zinc finger, CCHC-type [Melia azedarach]|uniref:Zinc finger, CCHC-type n=1 Tax=Melia azedarach TaxID=155640 RepID=A0ACC1YCJ6_MELAZ|nr:Zinc finger, CCHC-type [Melia azedarach]